MLSSRLPFEGDYAPSVMHSIVHEDPRPITEHVAGLPGAVTRILDRCLKKLPELRYAEAGEIVVDLLQARDDLTSRRKAAARAAGAGR